MYDEQKASVDERDREGALVQIDRRIEELEGEIHELEVRIHAVLREEPNAVPVEVLHNPGESALANRAAAIHAQRMRLSMLISRIDL